MGKHNGPYRTLHEPYVTHTAYRQFAARHTAKAAKLPIDLAYHLHGRKVWQMSEGSPYWILEEGGLRFVFAAYRGPNQVVHPELLALITVNLDGERAARV